MTSTRWLSNFVISCSWIQNGAVATETLCALFGDKTVGAHKRKVRLDHACATLLPVSESLARRLREFPFDQAFADIFLLFFRGILSSAGFSCLGAAGGGRPIRCQG
ncbi:hypothetical protein [Pandoraea terrae]|uniref:hypothetical protein n=1 Tax=Pandoraea terrae TaxID=1537710 RepID=UPI00123F2C93|nr:hypothetical protein [Pandoraea terrae]